MDSMLKQSEKETLHLAKLFAKDQHHDTHQNQSQQQETATDEEYLHHILSSAFLQEHPQFLTHKVSMSLKNLKTHVPNFLGAICQKKMKPRWIIMLLLC